MSELILYEQIDAVAVISLNRPQRLNAMNQAMLDELNKAASQAEQDKTVRAVVLTGTGTAFSSGFDLKAQAENTPHGIAEWRPVLRRNFDACMSFWHLAKPTVAAVHGPALAGACELAMACDITIADETGIFGEPELRFGAGIVVMLLPWMVGPKRAKEIILLGLDNISAREAKEMGLINRVVPKGEDLKTALSIAKRLSRIDPPLLTQTKQALNNSYSIMGMEKALESALETDTQIEGEGMPTKAKFLQIARDQGLREAITWRDSLTEED
ncbi:MAG: enoyl-CoA hydratase/isomerase family protein [Arenicellales bacterium]|jgi:enoyl-CoA hydratase|nr:enoyl-CoA hydratase/isomerase family protein [Arenicellales bacterium]